MDIRAQVMLLLPGLLFAAATYAGCRWWYGRRLATLSRQLGKLDRARQTADESARQARRQIEQLQKDLAAQYRTRAEVLSARKRAQTGDETRRELERVLAVAGGEADTRPPIHGFADTQPMS